MKKGVNWNSLDILWKIITCKAKWKDWVKRKEDQEGYGWMGWWETEKKLKRTKTNVQT